MAEKVELTDRRILALRPARPGQRYEVADTHVIGLRLRVGDAATARGKARQLTWTLIARWPGTRNPGRRALGTYPDLSLAEARTLARDWKAKIAAGIDPAQEAKACRTEVARADTRFAVVANAFLQRHVDRAKLRTASEIKSMIDAIRPHFGQMQMADIRRRDLMALLDRIEDTRGPRAADKTLGVLSRMFNWWAARDDEFASPIVRGMRRVSATERARSRILGDDELRAFWKATGEGRTFGAFCRLLLLTGQRRAKVAAMRWQDIDEAGTWSIPAEPREKINAGRLGLPPLAREVLAGVPRIAGNPHVFAGRTRGASISGFSKSKRRLDAAMAEALGEPVATWVLHDLRRTARSLMARAGVRPDIAERALGHRIAGVEGIYDRHSYAAEKADALARLAALLEAIVRPPAGNGVPMERGHR
ncbi:MAG: tyrosine-type recombinase/integrase [Sphingomonadaceae bacterium]